MKGYTVFYKTSDGYYLHLNGIMDLGLAYDLAHTLNGIVLNTK